MRYMKCGNQPVSFSADTILSSGNRSSTPPNTRVDSDRCTSWMTFM